MHHSSWQHGFAFSRLGLLAPNPIEILPPIKRTDQEPLPLSVRFFVGDHMKVQEASQLIDTKALALRLSVHIATLHRLNSAGKIGPKPIYLSKGCVRWHLPTIACWIAESNKQGHLIDRVTWDSLNGQEHIAQ